MGAFKGQYSRLNLFSEAKRYIGVYQEASMTNAPRPWVDADWNEFVRQTIRTRQRSILDISGSGTVGNGFKLKPAPDGHQDNNFSLTGGDGTVAGAGFYYVGGLRAYIVSDIEYSPALNRVNLYNELPEIHHKPTAILAGTLIDTSASWNNDQLVGRTLYVVDVNGNGTSNVIIENNATQIKVANNAVLAAADASYYWVGLTTPAAGQTRTDYVFLDVYLDEITVDEDSNLDHGLAPGAANSITGANRLKLQANVIVCEGLDNNNKPKGHKIPVGIVASADDADINTGDVLSRESFEWVDSNGESHWICLIATLVREGGVAAIDGDEDVDERDPAFGAEGLKKAKRWTTIGDGVTTFGDFNGAEGIQIAINRAVPGDNIHIKAGDYVLPDTVYFSKDADGDNRRDESLKRPIVIEGAGHLGHPRQALGISTRITKPANKDAFNTFGAHVVFRDIEFAQGVAGSTTGHCIAANISDLHATCSNVIIERCLFSALQGEQAIRLEDVVRWRIKDCVFGPNYTAGGVTAPAGAIDIIGHTEVAHHGIIEDCHFMPNNSDSDGNEDDYKIRILQDDATTTFDVKIKNCVFGQDTFSHTDKKVKVNSVDGGLAGYGGILIGGGVANVDIDGCTFGKFDQYAILAKENPDGATESLVSVRNSVFLQNTLSYIYAGGVSHGWSIKDNIFASPPSAANKPPWVQLSTDTTITGNRFGIGTNSNLTGGPCLYLAGACTVSNNTFNGEWNTGDLEVGGVGIIVNGTTLSDSHSGLSSVVISDNSFTALEYGIYLHYVYDGNGAATQSGAVILANSSITGNSFKEIKAANISMAARVNHCSITGNTSETAAQNSYFLVSTSANDGGTVPTNCVVSGNTANTGIYLTGKNMVVSDNVFGGSKTFAIPCINLAHISYSTISGNTLEGAQAAAHGIQLPNNAIHMNIVGNTISNMATRGINVGQATREISIKNNHILSCGGHGIYLFKSNADAGPTYAVSINGNYVAGNNGGNNGVTGQIYLGDISNAHITSNNCLGRSHRGAIETDSPRFDALGNRGQIFKDNLAVVQADHTLQLSPHSFRSIHPRGNTTQAVYEASNGGHLGHPQIAQGNRPLGAAGFDSFLGPIGELRPLWAEQDAWPQGENQNVNRHEWTSSAVMSNNIGSWWVASLLDRSTIPQGAYIRHLVMGGKTMAGAQGRHDASLTVFLMRFKPQIMNGQVDSHEMFKIRMTGDDGGIKEANAGVHVPFGDDEFFINHELFTYVLFAKGTPDGNNLDQDLADRDLLDQRMRCRFYGAVLTYWETE